MRKDTFDKYIRPVLTYVGAIGAVLTSIAYIVLIFVLIIGFNAQKNLSQSIIFAVITALVGLIIMQLLKVQGISFAKETDNNKEILLQYYNTNTKDKKPHSIKYYWITSLLKDVLVKGASVAISSAGIIYIVIEGSNDWNMLLLAIVNWCLFFCFGLLSLTSAYDYYNERHIPYILQEIEKVKKETENVRNQEEQSNDNFEKSPGASSGEQGTDCETLEY